MGQRRKRGRWNSEGGRLRGREREGETWGEEEINTQFGDRSRSGDPGPWLDGRSECKIIKQ